MEHDPKQLDKRVAHAMQLNMTPKWAEKLKALASKYAAPLKGRSATLNLVYEGKVPIFLSDYQVIVNDLMASGYNDILEIVLANLPSAVTELQLTWIVGQPEVERLSAINILSHALLLNPKGSVVAVHFRDFYFRKEELSLLANGVAHTSTLQVITFDSCQIREGDVTGFFKCLLQTNGTIKSLRMTATRSGMSSLAEFLPSNVTLSHLKLMSPIKKMEAPSSTRVAPPPMDVSPFAHALFQNRSLSSFEYCNFDQAPDSMIKIITALSGHPKLKRLALRNALDFAAVDALIAMMRTTPVLEELFLADVQIGHDRARMLIAALRSVTSLTINGRQIPPAETRSMLNGLLTNERKLTVLNWSYANLDTEGVHSLGQLIGQNTNLKVLCLPATKSSMQPVLDAMEFNNCIEVLNLTASCDMKAAPSLSFEGLKKNNKLRKLVLSSNKMNTEACKKIAPFISHHSSIKDIELNSCAIDSDGFKIFSGEMEGNATIRSLSLTNNNPSPQALSNFIGNLKLNHGLVSLKLMGIGPPKSISTSMLKEGLLQHPSLIDFDHHPYTAPEKGLLREIDFHLHKNFLMTGPAVTEYLRGLMKTFAWMVLGYGDLGNAIWQHFLKDEPKESEVGVLADLAALRDVLNLRQVVLGSPEYRGTRVQSPPETDPAGEPPKKIQRLN